MTRMITRTSDRATAWERIALGLVVGWIIVKIVEML